MTHNVRQTSLTVYREEIEPDLGRRQMVTLLAFKRRVKPSSDKEIANFLGKPINTITPRRNELVDKELVEEHHRGECEVTGRSVIKWVMTDKGEEIVEGFEGTLEDLLKEEKNE